MNIFNKNLLCRTISIFVLLTLYLGLCLEAAALEEMAVGDVHDFEEGHWILVEGADVDSEEAFFVLYKEGRKVDTTHVRRGNRFSLDDEIFHFEATLDSVFRSEDTIMVHLTDYNWGPIPTPVITPAPATPASTPMAGPGFSFYLIIFLVFSLAIGLPLIFTIYRKRKPPSGGQKQQKPPEPEDYAQKIEEYHAKMEEWKKEGYDVSELKEVLEGKK